MKAKYKKDIHQQFWDHYQDADDELYGRKGRKKSDEPTAADKKFNSAMYKKHHKCEAD